MLIFTVAHEWSKVFSYYNQVFCSRVLWVMWSSVIQLSLEEACVEAEMALQPEGAVRSQEGASCNDFKSCSTVFTSLQCLCWVGRMANE